MADFGFIVADKVEERLIIQVDERLTIIFLRIYSGCPSLNPMQSPNHLPPQEKSISTTAFNRSTTFGENQACTPYSRARSFLLLNR